MKAAKEKNPKRRYFDISKSGETKFLPKEINSQIVHEALFCKLSMAITLYEDGFFWSIL